MGEFASSGVARIPLSGENRWIEIKQELNALEGRQIFGRMIRFDTITPGEPVQINPEQVGFTKVVAYLIGWSFTDDSGAMIPVSDASINNLKRTTYQEIVKAIDEYEAEQEAVTKNQTGAIESKATSASVAP